MDNKIIEDKEIQIIENNLESRRYFRIQVGDEASNTFYCKKYMSPSIATDGIIFGFDYEKRSLKVLLVKRQEMDGNEPNAFGGCWAFPGGFLRPGETVEECIIRELAEEANFKIDESVLKNLSPFSDPDRDPREWVISLPFYTIIKDTRHVCGGDDASDAKWFDVNRIETWENVQENRRNGIFKETNEEKDQILLAFDHAKILEAARKRLARDLYFEPVGFDLLPEMFTVSQVQHLYEQILENILPKALDRRNFAKKLRSIAYIPEYNGGKGKVGYFTPREFAKYPNAQKLLVLVEDDDEVDAFLKAQNPKKFEKTMQQRERIISSGGEANRKFVYYRFNKEVYQEFKKANMGKEF